MNRLTVLRRGALALLAIATLTGLVARVTWVWLTPLDSVTTRPEGLLGGAAGLAAIGTLLATGATVVRALLWLLGTTPGPHPDTRPDAHPARVRGRAVTYVASLLVGAAVVAPQAASAGVTGAWPAGRTATATARTSAAVAVPGTDDVPVDPTYLGATTRPTTPPAGATRTATSGVPGAAPDAHRRSHVGATTQRPTLVVRPGDTLWALAARALADQDGTRDVRGPAADDAAISRAVNALYAANHDVVGSDPDLIVPGTRLVVPDLRPGHTPGPHRSGADR